MGNGPLEGVRVVEWAHQHLGPGASMFLSDMGAEVIKVETRNGGDSLRRLASLWGHSLFRTGHLLVANSVLNAGTGVGYWLLAARLNPPGVMGVNSAAISAMTASVLRPSSSTSRMAAASRG